MLTDAEATTVRAHIAETGSICAHEQKSPVHKQMLYQVTKYFAQIGSVSAHTQGISEDGCMKEGQEEGIDAMVKLQLGTA